MRAVRALRPARAWLAAGIAVSCALACGDKSEPPVSEGKPAASPAKSASDGKPADGADEKGEVSIIKAKTKNGEETSIAVQAPKGWKVMRAPSTPDPHGGKFTLRDATAGLPKKGTLAARIETSAGDIYCDLFEEKKPNTVANFVGLARGKRTWWDGEALEWSNKPFYDGNSFHRIMAGFMIQGGDRGGAIGYTIHDEIAPGEKHDRPGLLCQANKMADFNDSQFFITEQAAPHIDGRYTIFGECAPLSVVQRISHAPQSGKPDYKPLTPIAIKTIEVKRVVGGIAKWRPADDAVNTIPGVVPQGKAVQIK